MTGVIGLVLGYGVLIEPFWVEVHHVNVQDAQLNRVLAGMTAVDLTDLHIASLGKREQRVLELVDEIKPDFIFLTGDYVKWNGDYEPALELLSRLKARVGVWAVMGDYDYSNDRKSCLFCHEPGTGRPTKRHKVHFLRNSVETVNLGGQALAIAGLDGGESGRLRDQADWPQIQSGTAAIVLMHSPLGFESVEVEQNVFILAGDTHGGQVPLPGWVWKLFGYEKDAQYEKGLFREGHKQMYVSRGIGTSHIPVRLFRRPEIVVFHF